MKRGKGGGVDIKMGRGGGVATFFYYFTFQLHFGKSTYVSEKSKVFYFVSIFSLLS